MQKNKLLLKFQNIDIVNFPKVLKKQLDSNLTEINNLLLQKKISFNWDNLMALLEANEDKVEKLFAPISQLQAVNDNPKLRKSYEKCLNMLSAYESTIGHNKDLYLAIKSIDASKLDKAQRKIIIDTLRDFELAGVALEALQKLRFQEIQSSLAQLSQKFENNILDSENSYQLHITDVQLLKGLPQLTIDAAQNLAHSLQKSGWILTLQYPCFIAVMRYADSENVRKEIYQAYVTRAGEGKFCNSEIIEQILQLRQEKSKLLGFDNFASLSVQTKMAETPEKILEFLEDLTSRAFSQGALEFSRLEEFVGSSLKPWDIAYYSEKKRQAKFEFSQEELREYFPIDKVLEGLFIIVKRLFGVNFEEVLDFEKWHENTKCYQVVDESSAIRGYIYIDLFARKSKRGGAWMASLQSRRKLHDSIQLPIASLNCNFTPPDSNNVSTLLHDEVTTLFHELGHCLHHVLTKVDYCLASGINNVEWDAVELPSQFLENWCWEQGSLQLITSHIKTQEKLPDLMYQKLLSAKNFHSAMAMLRQIEFALFDLKIHKDPNIKNIIDVYNILDEVRKQTTVVPVAKFDKFPCSFSHIFAGGYAAGYYSYKWAEVLSSDAFSRFEEEGIFNAHTGKDFLHFILEVGGSVAALDAYIGFRGRKPDIDALLKHCAIK